MASKGFVELYTLLYSMPVVGKVRMHVVLFARAVTLMVGVIHRR